MMRAVDMKNKDSMRKPIAMDFFSGSGSVSAALKKAGYAVVAALDLDPSAAATYKANHPEVFFFEGDIRKISPELLSQSMRGDKIDLLTICAPCQPFSSQNRKKSSGDERASLLISSLPFIKKIMPKNIWIENVPGIGSVVIPKFQQELKNLGYYFNPPVRVDAADLGVPQRRVRMVFLATLDQEGCIDFSQLPTKTKSRVTVRSALQGLSKLVSCQATSGDSLHVARKHSDLTIKRLRAIPADGGSRSSLPMELQLRCHTKISSNSFPDVYGRMSWDLPAPTLTSGCTDVTRGRFAHPEEDRAITLREAARLQTFPDDYIFCGNKSQIALQIGNAVPMKMAYELFRLISKSETSM